MCIVRRVLARCSVTSVSPPPNGKVVSLEYEEVILVPKRALCFEYLHWKPRVCISIDHIVFFLLCTPDDFPTVRLWYHCSAEMCYNFRFVRFVFLLTLVVQMFIRIYT